MKLNKLENNTNKKTKEFKLRWYKGLIKMTKMEDDAWRLEKKYNKKIKK